MTLIFVEPVLIAVRTGSIFQLRLTDPAPILIAIVLSTPEATSITLRSIADEARLVGTVPVQSAHRFTRITSIRAACGIADVAFILVEMVLLAIRTRSVFKLRLAYPATILVPGVLAAPQAASVALRGVTHEAGLAVLVRVRNLIHIRCVRTAGC